MGKKLKVENLKTLIEVLRNVPHNKEINIKFRNKSGFNMLEYINDCGSPSCIAGYICAIDYKDDLVLKIEDISKVKIAPSHPSRYDPFEYARDLLGLTYRESNDLFTPGFSDSFCYKFIKKRSLNLNGDYDLDTFVYKNILPSDAVKVLENFLETGKIKWSIILKDDK